METSSADLLPSTFWKHAVAEVLNFDQKLRPESQTQTNQRWPLSAHFTRLGRSDQSSECLKLRSKLMFTLLGPVSFKSDFTMLQAVAGAFGMTGLNKFFHLVLPHLNGIGRRRRRLAWKLQTLWFCVITLCGLDRHPLTLNVELVLLMFYEFISYVIYLCHVL